MTPRRFNGLGSRLQRQHVSCLFWWLGASTFQSTLWVLGLAFLFAEGGPLASPRQDFSFFLTCCAATRPPESLLP